jgi:preprotein translocase subunit SecG
MTGVVSAIHVLICLGLIGVVLAQTGRGSGMASVFGGGGGGSVMGGKGFGGLLAKATGVLAVAFMLTSITLSLIPRGGGQSSVLEEMERQPAVESPAQTESRTMPGAPGETGQPPVETGTPAETPSGE